MALFKICRGLEENLPESLTNGYAYFCTNTGSFFIDHLDTNGSLVRSKISANYADKLRFKDGDTTIEIDPSQILTHENYAEVIGAATVDNGGLMSATDKAKLDGIQEGATNSVTTISSQLSPAEILALEPGMYYFTDAAYFKIYLYDSWVYDETTYVTDVSIKGLCRIDDIYIYSYDNGFYYYKDGTRVLDGVEQLCCATESARVMQDSYAGMYQLNTRQVINVRLRQYSDGSIEYENNNNYIEYLRTFGWNISGVLTQCTIHTNNTNYDFELYEVEKLVGDDEYLTGIKYVGYKDGFRYDVVCELDNITVTKTEMITTTATTSKAGLMSSVDKTKLDSIAKGAQVNVQADWNETYDDEDAYIKNKPFGDFYTIKRSGDETVTVAGTYTTFTLITNDILEYEELSGVATYSGASGSFPTVNRFGEHIYGAFSQVLVVTKAGASYSQIGPNAFPEVGVYFGAGVEYAVLQVKKIPEKYILSKYATQDDVAAKIADNAYGVVTTSADGLMSASDKSKLDGIATGANNYSHPTNSGNKHIPSGGSSGKVLKWSADGTATWGDDKDTTYSVATTGANGLMSSTDKSKLDGIATGANNYSHPTSSGNKHIPSGGSSGQILRWSADGTAVWGADNNTTYTAATTSSDGLMTAAMVTKLSGIAAGANNYTLPAAGSALGGVKSGGDVTISSGTITVNDDSHNHVISNVDGLQGALDGKAPSSHTHTKSQITDFPTSMTPTAHNQAASTITAGTLGGQVVANASATATIGTAQVRNIYAGTTDMTPGSSTLATGTIYLVYE